MASVDGNALTLDAVRALRRGWWLVLLVAAVATAGAAFLTAREERIYRATATLVVVPNEMVSDTSDLLRSLDTLERRTIVATLSRISGTPDTRAQAAQQLGLDGAGLQGFAIRGSVVPNTNLVQIEVTGPERERAEALADAVAEVARREARSLYPIFSLRSFATATSSSRPISPNPARNLVVATVVGVFVGVLAALAMDAWRRSG
ncbi:MAG TPA: Wzz/FepE/Etk N-terminal domain-containing protein [Planctomycetota bacterium]|nr:Wzz/FepE/Etk N-terminal domain-containing protein [Planctomycetota bacterium]